MPTAWMLAAYIRMLKHGGLEMIVFRAGSSVSQHRWSTAAPGRLEQSLGAREAPVTGCSQVE